MCYGSDAAWRPQHQSRPQCLIGRCDARPSNHAAVLGPFRYSLTRLGGSYTSSTGIEAPPPLLVKSEKSYFRACGWQLAVAAQWHGGTGVGTDRGASCRRCLSEWAPRGASATGATALLMRNDAAPSRTVRTGGPTERADGKTLSHIFKRWHGREVGVRRRLPHERYERYAAERKSRHHTTVMIT